MKYKLITLSAALCCVACQRPMTQVTDAQARQPIHPAADTLVDETTSSEQQAAMASKIQLLQDADGRYRMSVEQAVYLCMQNNRDLHIQRLDLEIAQRFIDIERASFDPELLASISAGEERSSETDRGTGNQFDVESEDTALSLGVSQSFATGTDLEIDLSLSRDVSDRTPDQAESRLGLTLTQALLQGFGAPVQTARIQQAHIDARISEFEVRGFTERLIAQTEIVYWRLIAASERIASLEQAVTIAQQQQAETEERIRVGVTAKNALAVARSELARHEQALIDARSELRALELRLWSYVQVPIKPYFEHAIHADSVADEALIITSSLEEHLQLALVQRAEIGEARLRLERNQLATTMTRNGLLPKLDFFIDLGKTGFGDNYNAALQNMDENTYDLSVGLDFSYTLGARSAAANHDVAFFEVEQAEAAIKNMEDLVGLEVRLAWNEVQRATQQIKASRTTLALQKETLRSEQERLKAGTSTSLLVAQAMRDVLAAEVSLIEALSEQRIACIQLYLADGSLLERRGIVLHK